MAKMKTMITITEAIEAPMIMPTLVREPEDLLEPDSVSDLSSTKIPSHKEEKFKAGLEFLNIQGSVLILFFFA